MPMIYVTPPPAAADFRPGTMPGLSARRVGRGETLSAVLVTLAPGGEISPHTQTVEEVQHILSGHGLARDATGKETPVGPGATVFCPAGPEGGHGLTNPGPEPLRLLIVYTKG